jgi:hypothetical protein
MTARNRVPLPLSTDYGSAGGELRPPALRRAYNEVMQYTPSTCRPALFGSD